MKWNELNSLRSYWVWRHLLCHSSLLCVNHFISTGCWDRWTCPDWDPGHQKQWGNTCDECCLSGRWVLTKRGLFLFTFVLKKPFQNLMCPPFTGYKKSLEEAIQSDTSGHFCRILVSLVQVITFSPHPLAVHSLSTDLKNQEKKAIHWYLIVNNLCLPFQGAREEGPANLERANADAQVIHCKVLFVLRHLTVSRQNKWKNRFDCFFLSNLTGTCRCMQCRLWWHGDEVHEYSVHQKLPTS